VCCSACDLLIEWRWKNKMYNLKKKNQTNETKNKKRLRRHERPVIGDAVSIVHLDEDLVVVHKPPSVPVSCHSSLMMFVVVVVIVLVVIVR
jgi:23S rRNA-/tRNA-specific pseudouridylate synthase